MEGLDVKRFSEEKYGYYEHLAQFSMLSPLLHSIESGFVHVVEFAPVNQTSGKAVALGS